MAQATTYRINRLAKEFNLKSKDIVDLLAENGLEGKTHMAILEPAEFNLFIELITSKNQITNLDAYVKGEAVIPKKVAKEKAPAEKTEEPAPVKEEVKAASKAAPKAEPKAEPKKTEAPVKEEAPVKTEAPKKNAPAVKAEEPVKVEESAKAEPKTEVKPEIKAEPVRQEPKKEAPARQESPVRTQQPRDDRAPRQQERRPDGRPERQQGDRPQGQRPDGRGQRPDGRPERQQNDRPQGQRPDGRGQRPDGRPERQQGDRPQRTDSRQPMQTQQKPVQGTAQGRGQVEAPKKNRGPWEPTAGASTQPKTKKPEAQGEVRQRTGNTRIVDTRSSSVDLSKYDEKLNSYVSDRDDNLVTKQKLKKQNNKSVSSKDRDKERRAMEKLRKEEIERQRRQQLVIQIPDEITVGELANRLKITASEVIKKLMMNGIMATVNEVIDFETAFLITEELGVKAEHEVVVTIEDQLFESADDDESDLIERSPVVCVMGHVDHGKTSLLDAIRHTRVTAREAGGITQHIGAYRVDVDGKYITFLDTPGHEAFTAMRLRGAQSTDIAIIVVAADDGIMPQTVEAINHAKAAGVEIIVAINKMDKPTANPDQVKQELTKYDLVPEEWGGDIICVPVSAMTKMGIDDLLENVLLIAEMQEYKANPNRRASGLVIEAKLDKGRGPVATMLVQNGTLHTGDIVIAGTSVGRVRAMTDENGRQLKTAGPSVPVEITGLAEVPSAGDEFNAVEDERMARELADQRREKEKEELFRANARANLGDMFAQIESGIKDFNIIVKADVKGSAEAVKASLQKITNEEVRIQIIHSAVGGIIESDVQLAAASNAIIVGFNVRPDKSAIDMAERMNVEVRTYRVIYECLEEIEAAMKGMLAPKYREEVLGHAQVRQTIHVPNVGTIAGSYVQDGKIARNAQIRIVRDGFVIFEDKISSLRHFKEDRREMAQGYECGIGLERFNDIKEGDILECFQMVEIER